MARSRLLEPIHSRPPGIPSAALGRVKGRAAGGRIRQSRTENFLLKVLGLCISGVPKGTALDVVRYR